MQSFTHLKWNKVGNLNSKSYICGYCGSSIASEHGYDAAEVSEAVAYIFICHKCTRPTFFQVREGIQVPGHSFGNEVLDIPDASINLLYSEARNCTSVNSFTASIMCCRKLLMHIAVSKGAAAGLSFAKYVDFLSDKGFVPPDGKDWVDHIRNKGNDANHEIVIMNKNDAEDLITFIEMLLKFIYEFPAKMKQKREEVTPK